MNYSFYLARRLSPGAEGRKASPAVKVAITAVALSVAVMLGAIAIVLGFKREIRSKVLGFNPHITLYAVAANPGESNLVSLSPSLRELLNQQPYITDFSLEASIPAIMKTPTEFKGVYMKSLSGEAIKEFLRNSLVEGKLPSYLTDTVTPASRKAGVTIAADLEILISQKAASQLGLKAGDRIDTYFMTGEIRVRPLLVAGVFDTHFEYYDDIYIYGSLPLIQKLGEVGPEEGTSIVVTTDNFNSIEENSNALQQALGRATAEGLLYRYYRVDNALNQGAAYFQWLDLLDTNVVVILTLMLLVSIATLISGMLIIILDKKRFIGLIRALGASVSSTRRVFIYLAIRVGVVGLAIGNLLMIGFLYAEDRWHFLPLDPEAYYIDYVPVELSWGWFAALNLGIILLMYVSLILPSRFVAKISPAETMRYE